MVVTVLFGSMIRATIETILYNFEYNAVKQNIAIVSRMTFSFVLDYF